MGIAAHAQNTPPARAARREGGGKHNHYLFTLRLNSPLAQLLGLPRWVPAAQRVMDGEMRPLRPPGQVPRVGGQTEPLRAALPRARRAHEPLQMAPLSRRREDGPGGGGREGQWLAVPFVRQLPRSISPSRSPVPTRAPTSDEPHRPAPSGPRCQEHRQSRPPELQSRALRSPQHGPVPSRTTAAREEGACAPMWQMRRGRFGEVGSPLQSGGASRLGCTGPTEARRGGLTVHKYKA